MEMNQIRYFLAVCEHRNFTHAAQASNVSQPSLTAAIKKLEGEFNGALFLRDRAGCRLTPLGELIKPRLQKVLDEAAEAKADAVRHVRLKRVPIRVGVGPTVGQARLVEAARHHRAQLPEADIELIVASESALRHGTPVPCREISRPAGRRRTGVARACVTRPMASPPPHPRLRACPQHSPSRKPTSSPQARCAR